MRGGIIEQTHHPSHQKEGVAGLKRTRRIEVVKFSRRVTVSQRGISVEQAEDPDTEFPEILGVVSPPTEEPSNDKIRAVGIAPPRTPFLRRLLKVGVTPGPRRIVNKNKGDKENEKESL